MIFNNIQVSTLRNVDCTMDLLYSPQTHYRHCRSARLHNGFTLFPSNTLQTLQERQLCYSTKIYSISHLVSSLCAKTAT